MYSDNGIQLKKSGITTLKSAKSSEKVYYVNLFLEFKLSFFPN